jgi:ribosomal protein S18 acetylase RimI-like enzyme
MKNFESLNKLQLTPAFVGTTQAQILSDFYAHLPNRIKQLFKPHPFDFSKLTDYIQIHYRYRGFLLKDKDQIYAYIACYLGHFEHDMDRFNAYDFPLSFQRDAQIAPIVRPGFQGTGLAQELLHYACEELMKSGITRIFLWGGVKTDNLPAIRFYQKTGFQEIGRFEHEGQNIDMCFSLI